MHCPGQGIGTTVEITHDQGDYISSPAGIDVRRVLQSTGVQRSRGRVPEIPQPGSNLATPVRVAGIIEDRCFILAIAPVIEIRLRTTRNGYGAAVKIFTTMAVGNTQCNQVCTGLA